MYVMCDECVNVCVMCVWCVSVWWLCDDCVMIMWWLCDECVMSVCDVTHRMWWLWVTIMWWLCVMIVWWVFHECVWWFCLMIMWWLCDDCVTIVCDDYVMIMLCVWNGCKICVMRCMGDVCVNVRNSMTSEWICVYVRMCVWCVCV